MINLQPLLPRRVIIFLNHYVAVKPITLETVAENCFAPGNEEKETPGRPRFDIADEILEELCELGFRSGQYKMQAVGWVQNAD